MNSNIVFPQKKIDANFIAKEAGAYLVEQLAWMTIIPRRIINFDDHECGIADELNKRYQNIEIVTTLFNEEVNDDWCKEKSIDLISANFILPWCHNITNVLKTWQQFLCPEGVLLLSALGPDTLKECPDSLQPFIKPQLMDMHDLGDLLMKAGFADPVVEVNYLNVHYRNIAKLAADLHWSGMINLPIDEIEKNFLENKQSEWELTYELIIAHAFGKAAQQINEDGIVKIPISMLRR